MAYTCGNLAPAQHGVHWSFLVEHIGGNSIVTSRSRRLGQILREAGGGGASCHGVRCRGRLTGNLAAQEWGQGVGAGRWYVVP